MVRSSWVGSLPWCELGPYQLILLNLPLLVFKDRNARKVAGTFESLNSGGPHSAWHESLILPRIALSYITSSAPVTKVGLPRLVWLPVQACMSSNDLILVQA